MDGIKQHLGPYQYTIKIMNFALARSLPLARSRCSSCDFLLIFNPGAPMGPIGPQWGPMGPQWGSHRGPGGNFKPWAPWGPIGAQ